MTHVVEPAGERPDQRHPVHRPPSPEPVAAQREVTEATARSAPPMSARAALLLQRQAGNRATARLMAQRRQAAAASQAPRSQPTAVPAQRSSAPATVPVSPDGGAVVQRLVAGRAGPGQDPKFAALKQDARTKQKGLAAHPPAQAEAKAAQGAAKPPPDDKEAQGKTANAEKMNAAKPGEFDKAAFIKAVNDAIAKQAPKNLDEADKFADSGKANAVKGEVQGKVTAGKEGSAKAIETTTKAPPDTAAAKDKPVTPLQPDKPPPTPSAPNPNQAVPDKAPPAATDLSDGPKQVDKQMADAQVTEDQLAKSNEPEFTTALKDKKAAEVHAATAPGQVRAAEANTLAGAKAAAAQAGATAMTTMTADRVKAGQQVTVGKEGAKGSDESKRAQVTAKLQKVFDATKKDVEDILNGLDKKVDDKFDVGEKAARSAFTAEYKRKMAQYKAKRYSGPMGVINWSHDLIFDLPDEVIAFYEQARQGYVARMQGVISDVADVIGAELTRAKQRIATGRAELQAEVKKLPADLQAIGKQAAGEFEAKFDELTQAVNDKGTQLVDTLASKYTEALKAVDEEIAKEKEKNKGLVSKAVDAVKGTIDTILKLKDLLLGVLAKAAQAVSAIIKDPIGFLGHLVSAVGAGLRQFMANIATHLQKGLVSWLLGAAAAAGLQLPAKFDLKGIILLIGSLLGLTWAAIRGRIVKRGVPEQAMGAVESSVPVAKKIQSEGIGGIWEDIKDKVGDLKQNLLGKITEYLIPTVIVAGVTWLISLLTPASAFIKACKAIIDIVTFIIDRGAQIIAFVNAVLDAIIAIAAGGAGGVPALIETALATAIPVLIGFLAALLGIGGLADKVKKFFQALSKPVMKAVDWVVDKIVAFGKKIWAKIKGKFGRKNKDGKQTDKSDEKAAIKEAERLLAATPTRLDVEKRLPEIGRRHSVSLRLVSEGARTDGELVHVQTMSTGAYKLSPGSDEERFRKLRSGLKAVEAQMELDELRDEIRPLKMLLRRLERLASDHREKVLIDLYEKRTKRRGEGLAVDDLKRKRMRLKTVLKHAINIEEKRKRPECKTILAAMQSMDAELEPIAARIIKVNRKEQEDGIRAHLNDIMEKLVTLAKDHGYPSIDSLEHPSDFVLDGEIRSQFKDIRAHFYPSEYDKAVHDWVENNELPRLKKEKKNHPDLAGAVGYTDPNYYYCRYGHHLVPDVNYTYDHNPPVAHHWNNIGRKVKQSIRDKFYSTISSSSYKLEIMCGPCNFSKGSGGINYERSVELGFRGPGE
jgi:hypothetical protein